VIRKTAEDILRHANTTEILGLLCRRYATKRRRVRRLHELVQSNHDLAVTTEVIGAATIRETR